jgi:CRISPR-associated endonuclease Csn1
MGLGRTSILSTFPEGMTDMDDATGLSLGIDLGIASCGWAILRQTEEDGTILGLGARSFETPETSKERTPTNQIRRTNRLMRRVTRRRAARMTAIRALCRRFGLGTEATPEMLNRSRADPWTLRAEGLDRILDGEELAAALLHIGKHRGFKSNSKRDRGRNAPDESSKMLKQIDDTRARLGLWRTVGEMFARDPAFDKRKRNRDGDFSRSILRDDQVHEVAVLFGRQRRLGNPLAGDELEQAYTDIAFFQRPIRDSAHLVGFCPFIPDQRRAALHAYSFERFRLLARLAHLRLKAGRTERPLTPEEIATASADFGGQCGLSYKRLRKLLALGAEWRFEGVKPEAEKHDVVARSGDAMPGTRALRQALPEDRWRALTATPETLDRIAFVLSFRDDLASIRTGLSDLNLEPPVFEALVAAAERGDFGAFKRAGHLSAAACRAILPHLERGLVYSEACKAAGFDHAAKKATTADQITNPVARKALGEAVKQVRALIREYGLPDRIHVELARDVGKSPEERDEIKNGIDKRNTAKDTLRKEFRETVGRECGGAEDLLRYELWKEQNGRCLYTDAGIPPGALVAADNTVQVDHILPWSRSGDDGFINKTLCLAGANQEKKGRTPFEWFGADDNRWAGFVARVEALKTMKGRKKRNLLLKDASVLEEKFRNRNLNDTRYACRALLALLEGLYPADGRRHVFARPGPLTDRLRRAWGIQDLKKGPDGKRRDDDRHHALDALIVAATSESALQRLTRAFQEAERRGAPRDFSGFDLPWPGFVAEARAKLAEVFVSRPEHHRARGEGHAATIRQIVEQDGKTVVYERKAVNTLTLADLDRIKDAERNHKLVESLRVWLQAGQPKDQPPLSPKGDVIAKVRVKPTKDKKVDVPVRDGTAERGEMVRVDVFRKPNRKGVPEFFLVPVYPHQVMDPTDYPEPPHRAIQQGKDEQDWPEIEGEYEFLFSLRPFSYIEVVKSDGEVIEGYYRGTSRSTGAVSISQQASNNPVRPGIGTRTLHSLRKFYVDRLGRRFEIQRETRTWHGVVCI